MRIKKSVIAAMTIIAAFLAFDCLQINSVYASDKQGTDGTEMNAYEAEELEIYLGKDWSGKSFKLETDAGIYPGAVSVGEDGVLRVEIGGSKNYKLSVMDDGDENRLKNNTEAADNKESNITDKNQDKTIKEVTQPPVTDEVTNADIDDKSEGVDVEWKKDKTKKNGLTVHGIPLKHLIIFIVGMIIAIDGLIVINLIQKKRREYYEDEYNEEEYYDEEYDDDYEDEE